MDIPVNAIVISIQLFDDDIELQDQIMDYVDKLTEGRANIDVEECE